MVFIGSGVSIEQVPPPPKMDEVRRELDAAMLQAKKYCINNAREQHSSEDAPVKRYIFASTVMRNDRFFSLHSGRRSRSLTRVYIEEREARSKSAVPSLPKKNGFSKEDHEDGSLRLELHETIEGRRADIIEDDVTTVTDLEKNLPFEYHQWEHEISIQKNEPEPNTIATVWRVGDHLFSFEEPLDLNVKLPDQVHYFFTGEHLPEKRRLYTSLPNLSVAGLVETAAFDHSAHSFYGHGFRQVGTTHLSRTMESLNEDRLQLGTRPSLNEMRGEPPPEPYLPLRSRMSPYHIRSPPLSPTNEEWRRSPSPGFYRYSSCVTSGLEIIGRNVDRGPTEGVRSPVIQEEERNDTTPGDSHSGDSLERITVAHFWEERSEVINQARQEDEQQIDKFDLHRKERNVASPTEKPLGEDFERNLNHFWQMREGKTSLTSLARDDQRVPQKEEDSEAKPSIWDVKNLFGETRARAPPIRQTSEDQSSGSEEVDYAYKEPEDQTVTSAMELLMFSERRPSASLSQNTEIKMENQKQETEYENEPPSKRTSIQAKKNRFARKHTPYYDEAFFSSLEDELSEAAGTLELSHGYPSMTSRVTEMTSSLKPFQEIERVQLPKRVVPEPPYRPKVQSETRGSAYEQASMTEALFAAPETRTMQVGPVSPTGVTFPPYQSRRKEGEDGRQTSPTPLWQGTSGVGQSTQVQPSQSTEKSWQDTFKPQQSNVPVGYPKPTKKLPVDHSLSALKFEHQDLPKRRTPVPEYPEKIRPLMETVQKMAGQGPPSYMSETQGVPLIGTQPLPSTRLNRPPPAYESSWQTSVKQHLSNVSAGYPQPTNRLPVDHSSTHREFDHQDLPRRKVPLPAYPEKGKPPAKSAEGTADKGPPKSVSETQRFDSGREAEYQSPMPWQTTFKQKPSNPVIPAGYPEPTSSKQADHSLTHRELEHQYLPIRAAPLPVYPETGKSQRSTETVLTGFKPRNTDTVTTSIDVLSTRLPAVGSTTIDAKERFGRLREKFEDSGYGSRIAAETPRHGYTLVTADGEFPQTTKKPPTCPTPKPTSDGQPTHLSRVRHWEVEDTPPVVRGITSPESEEVAQINFPSHDSPKTKRKKYVIEKRVEEVVETTETLTDWWAGKKSFESAFGDKGVKTTRTTSQTSSTGKQVEEAKDSNHKSSQGFTKDLIEGQASLKEAADSMTKEMDRTFAQFNELSNRLIAEGENKLMKTEAPEVFRRTDKAYPSGYPQMTESITYTSNILANNEMKHSSLFRKPANVPYSATTRPIVTDKPLFFSGMTETLKSASEMLRNSGMKPSEPVNAPNVDTSSIAQGQQQSLPNLTETSKQPHSIEKNKEAQSWRSNFGAKEGQLSVFPSRQSTGGGQKYPSFSSSALRADDKTVLQEQSKTTELENRWLKDGYPPRSRITEVTETLFFSNLPHKELPKRSRPVPPYPDYHIAKEDQIKGSSSREAMDSMTKEMDKTFAQFDKWTSKVFAEGEQKLRNARETQAPQVIRRTEKTDLSDYPVTKRSELEEKWIRAGYPEISKKRQEVTETLVFSNLPHEELPKGRRPAPPYPDFTSGTGPKGFRDQEAATFESNLLDSWKLKKRDKPEASTTTSPTGTGISEMKQSTALPETTKSSFTSFKPKDIWDYHGYPRRTDRISEASEVLQFSEMERQNLQSKRDYPPYPQTASLKTSLGFGKSLKPKDSEAKFLPSRPAEESEASADSKDGHRLPRSEDRRESQTLNMMVGFGQLKEPRKMKWDHRGYPSFQRAQEIHETLAPREHVHIELSPRSLDYPPYPDAFYSKKMKKESDYAEILPKSKRAKDTEHPTRTIHRLHSHKTKAAPAPPSSSEIQRPTWFTRGGNLDCNGYPQVTPSYEATETISYSMFSEAPVPKRYSPIPTYPVRYSEFSRLLPSQDNPSMVESRRVRGDSAPPIPEHFKKPPPPYQHSPVRPPRHSDEVKGILKHQIPEEPAGHAPRRIPRTDSDLARRDFDAVFQDDSRPQSWDDTNSETQISSSEVREMESILRGATRAPTWQDDWDIAEEIVDESLKTAVCQSPSKSTEEHHLKDQGSNTSMKSFEMEPALGGRASETEAEIVPLPKPKEEKDYSKGLVDFRHHQKQKGFFNFFRRKHDDHVSEQFLEESPYNIQLVAGDRPDLYREEPHIHHQSGVKGRIKKRNSREDTGRKPFGGIFHFRRSQSHDEAFVEERPLEVLEEPPSRKRSSSMHEMFESARHNIAKSKNYIRGVAAKQKRRDPEQVVEEVPRLIGYEHGDNELPVDVPPPPRFPVYRRRSEVTADTSDSDPDNIKNILEGVIREKNEVIEKIETERQGNVESSYTSASTIEIGQGVRQDTLYHAVPINIQEEPVYPTSSENQSSIEEAALHYEEFQTTPVSHTTTTTYNAYYDHGRTVSNDLYADPPSPHHEEEELPNESMVVEPPSPELQRSAEKFATEFTEKLAKVEDVLREAELYVQKNERIYDSVYEERIYDEVPAVRLTAEVAPPVPSSPVPRRGDELHYAAVAIVNDDHLYKDDEHIYEEIGEAHVVESSPYAEPVHISEEHHIVESSPYPATAVHESEEHHFVESCNYPNYNPYDSTADYKAVEKEEPEYAEVPREDVLTKVVHKVEHSIAHLKQKFESKTEESQYGKIDAPKRKDYLYDENYNAQIEDQQLIRTPEIGHTPIDTVDYREVKPYVGSPSFNKLQKQFFPEDLEERKARWEDKEEVDLSVLKSPTTIVTNNGVTEIETRAYDKNKYEESSTVVLKSPVDKETALATLAIRRMSKNNQWSEDEVDTSRLYNAYESAPMSPVVKVSPLPSPRPVSVSPRFDSSPSSPRPESPKIVVKSQIVRPIELDIAVDSVSRSSPVERVVSSVEKTSASTEIQFQSGFVKDRRKMFENGGVPSQPSYAPVVKLRTTAGRTGSVVSHVKSVEVQPPAKVHEAISSPSEVELKRVSVNVGLGATPTKQEDSNKRMSVMEMRRAYEASVTASQSSSSTASPQRSRGNSQRRGTGEVQIGTGASLSKYSEEQSSAARRTIHRTLDKHMNEESVTIPLGQGVQVSIERRDESPLTIASNSTVGKGVSVVREVSPVPVKRTPSPSLDYGTTIARNISPAPVQSSPAPSVGHGATVISESQQKFFSTSSSTIGQGVSVQREVHQSSCYQQSSSSSIGYGVLPSSAPPPVVEPLIPVQPSLTIEVPLKVAQPVQEVPCESTAEVEEEPIPLQRNGSGRRSWPVKIYENNIRFDNQKKKLKMPDVDFSANGHLNGIEKMNGEENASLKDWDPRPLVHALYEVSYEPRLETKRNRFFNMEGHVEFPSDETNTLAELEREWKQRYIRTKEGRLQIFVSHCAEEAPAEDIVLSGCDIDANKEERTFTIHGGRDHIRMLLRVPSPIFDKWRQALLSHAASSQIDAYVKPVSRTMEHLSERVVIIEIGSCSIRGGRLTQETSLPQSFFPAIGIRTDDGKIIVGEDAYAPQVRHRGEFVRPIQASDPAVERYTMDKDVVRACMDKVVSDLQVDPSKYKVLLSIPQNIPIVLISELVTIALQDIKFQGAAITRQPSLILYAYDVTTGVVVDIGDRLNIVPVIDGYVVDSAICSIPYGATQVREALRSDLCANNKGLYSFQSPIEKLILRYAMEQASYVPEDYQKEEQSRIKDVMISLDPFQPTAGMQTKFNIDSSRFTCTEGLFRPKKWGLDTKGLHQLVHEAVQMSPIDSRRTLYRNIFLAGGASLLPGLAEKLEQELAYIVPNTIHTQVHISPWRYNAAYLGAQVVASSSTFEDKCVTAENLQKFLYNLSTSTF